MKHFEQKIFETGEFIVPRSQDIQSLIYSIVSPSSGWNWETSRIILYGHNVLARVWTGNKPYIVANVQDFNRQHKRIMKSINEGGGHNCGFVMEEVLLEGFLSRCIASGVLNELNFDQTFICDELLELIDVCVESYHSEGLSLRSIISFSHDADFMYYSYR